MKGLVELSKWKLTTCPRNDSPRLRVEPGRISRSRVRHYQLSHHVLWLSSLNCLSSLVSNCFGREIEWWSDGIASFCVMWIACSSHSASQEARHGQRGKSEQSRHHGESVSATLCVGGDLLRIPSSRLWWVGVSWCWFVSMHWHRFQWRHVGEYF